MQIYNNLLRVIFLLSTIVTVADCCSSRILLLKEETLKLVNQNSYEHDDYDDYPDDHTQQIELPLQEKLPQHVDIAAKVHFIKNYTNNRESDQSEDKNAAGESKTDMVTAQTPTADETLPPTAHAGSTPIPAVDDANAHEFITDPAVREKNTGNPKYHEIDLTFKMMRDVLSLRCSGGLETEFCLNGGRCFLYPIGNESFHSCECADGYVGERCESKSINISMLYVPSAAAHKKPTILTARMVFSFPMLMAISVIYIMIGAAIVFKRQPRAYDKHKYRVAGMLEERGSLLLDHCCYAD